MGPEPAGAAIDVRAVSKQFGLHRALDAVDLQVDRGGVHGLLGPNGAGKTTLLRMLLGLVRPDAGSVRVLGRDPFAAPGALPGLAGFVEAPRFYPYLSGAKNLDLLAALDGPVADGRAARALDAVGLNDRAGRKVRTYSTGMRQRLGLAAVLLRDPSLLVLDEPTAGLDPAGVLDLHDLVRSVAGEGRTVLLSSHDMAEVERLCDSVTILHRGRVVYSGGLAELRAQAPAPSFRLSTADDELARERVEAITGEPAVRHDDGLLVRAQPAVMDALVLDLADRGVPVRGLLRHDTALEALFLRLTADASDEAETVNA